MSDSSQVWPITRGSDCRSPRVLSRRRCCHPACPFGGPVAGLVPNPLSESPYGQPTEMQWGIDRVLLPPDLGRQLVAEPRTTPLRSANIIYQSSLHRVLLVAYRRWYAYQGGSWASCRRCCLRRSWLVHLAPTGSVHDESEERYRPRKRLILRRI